MNSRPVQAWHDLHPYDRLYASHLSAFYSEAQDLAPIIWPGMKLCPVCIFRQGGPAFLYKHPDPPKTFVHLGNDVWMGEQSELQLFGATQAEINGVLTAINYYDRSDPVELFYAELFHEMHHVYQCNDMPSLRADNPMLVITYPEDVENDALKLLENRLLLQMVLNDAPQTREGWLNLFFSCREKRQGIIGDDYMDMEKRAESVEGPATYCQYRYLQSRQKKAWDEAVFTVAQQHEFLSVLSQLSFGRQNLRQRLLMTGLAQCLILAQNDTPNWEQTYFTSDVLLSDFLFSTFPVRQVPIPEVDHLRAYASFHLEEEQRERQRRLEAFKGQDGICVTATFESVPECRAIDPMNAEAMDENTVMHNTMLMLGRDDNLLSFLTGGVMAQIADNVWQVLSITFFLESRKQLQIENGRVLLNLDGRQLSWRGEIVEESKDHISLALE